MKGILDMCRLSRRDALCLTAASVLLLAAGCGETALDRWEAARLPEEPAFVAIAETGRRYDGAGAKKEPRHLLAQVSGLSGAEHATK